MRYLTMIAVLLALAAAGAQSSDPENIPAPDARLVYESDTRAYYRPCG